jgi:hypothetical protein
LIAPSDAALDQGSAALTTMLAGGIAGHGIATWDGYFRMHPQAAGAVGKTAELRYEYHFSGEEPRSKTQLVSFRLPSQ